MLLRSITKHVTEQNWFAVFIDFLIVVVGVFIGIQVANWNETRQQQSLTAHYLQRITDDLEANILDAEQRVVYFSQTRSHGLAALSALSALGEPSEPSEPLGKQFIIDVYQASQALPRQFDNESYAEVNSIGAQVAIADVDIRMRLSTYFRSIQASVNNLTTIMPYRESIRSIMPYQAQKAVRDNCDDVMGVNQYFQHIITLPTSCEINLSRKDVDTAVKAILDAAIQDELTRQVSDLDTKLSSLQIFKDRTTLMIDYLRGLD
ncbi:hypothetical protein [Marinicella litoralis]|uniref:Uncharacterized protein n=2 Tax=Marinicella litoralis TaxID=644220 RepID=A0A4R6Y0C5_9GAMM|nr:hypothetical protein [Marinicella litoralis]TDR22348.1 hypothetical protein C8D91_0836 [Marinicella litoralis]